MVDAPDLMQPDLIKSGLKTEIIGKKIISYVQTSSTHDVALELAVSGLQEGTLIVAESQTRGRGSRNRKWLSPMGTSILASLILRPLILAHEVYLVTLITATAVAQAIRNMTQLPALIKWPNDILINGKKVSGILTEARIERDHVSFVVVGIGINVNIPKSLFPMGIADIATSLNLELGHNISRISLLQETLRQLENRYLSLKDHNYDDLIGEWKSLSATIGRWVAVDMPSRKIRGYALDMDGNGSLIIQADTGEVLRVIDDLIHVEAN